MKSDDVWSVRLATLVISLILLALVIWLAGARSG